MQKRFKDNDLDLLLNLIPEGKEHSIQGRDLMALTGWSFRQIKDMIKELRKTTPIISKVDGGGGYWIATKQEEIEEFIFKMQQVINTHLSVLSYMESHLELLKSFEENIVNYETNV